MAHRTFTDIFGRIWDVWSVNPASAVRSRAGQHDEAWLGRGTGEDGPRVRIGDRWVDGWLAFQTPGERRRLAPIPRAWGSSTDEELERLCGEAAVVPPARRLIE
jgi:hypothetical protein